MNIIDASTLLILLLCSSIGFLLGGVVILVEMLQLTVSLLFTISLKPVVIRLFSSFMNSHTLTEASSILVLFATVYLLLSIAVSLIYSFCEPFKGYLLNKIFGIICGMVIGFLVVATAMKFLDKYDYFKKTIHESYLYKIGGRK